MSDTDERKKYDWLPILADYLTSKDSGRIVAERWEVNEITMERKITDDSWVELRKLVQASEQAKLIEDVKARNWRDRETRINALGTLVDRFLNDPTSKITDAGVVAALKQMSVMLGDATERVEMTTLSYNMTEAIFPDAQLASEVKLVDIGKDDASENNQETIP